MEREETPCACKAKHTPRSPEFMKDIQTRLNKISGQIGGMKRMIEENRYCGDILIQISAAESALSILGYMILNDHMHSCVLERVKAGDELVMDELLSLMKRLK